MSRTITFLEDDVWAVESPVDVVEGESIPFACTYTWGNPSSPSAAAKKNNIDATDDVFPTNTPTASGAVVSLSAATGFVGNSRYVIYVTATVSSGTYVRQIMLKCKKAGEEQ